MPQRSSRTCKKSVPLLRHRKGCRGRVWFCLNEFRGRPFCPTLNYCFSRLRMEFSMPQKSSFPPHGSRDARFQFLKKTRHKIFHWFLPRSALLRFLQFTFNDGRARRTFSAQRSAAGRTLKTSKVGVGQFNSAGWAISIEWHIGDSVFRK